MACPSENTIQALVGGALVGDAHARIHRHIDACAACRTLVLELARDSDLEAQLTVGSEAKSDARIVGGRFQLARSLGRGGMGTVYEALDSARGTRVALKTLQRVSADSLLRFKTEFRAVQRIQHPNLVTVTELMEERGQWWIAMELIEGVGFLDHVRPRGQLDLSRLRATLPQLAAGLAALHAHALVHRDLKPQNVLVTESGRVVIVDFGLIADVAQSESNVVGTPAYMAPEQGVLQRIGPAADWYGGGAMLYEALTGVLPFTGAPLQVLVAKQHELPRAPRELAAVPEALDALCMALLAIDPAARLVAATKLGALEPAATPSSAHISPATAFIGRRRELVALADAFAERGAGRAHRGAHPACGPSPAISVRFVRCQRRSSPATS